MTPNPKSQATEKAELLPCPFCGGNPSIVGGDDYFTIHCNNCRAELVGGKREWVKKNWNRRAAPAFNAAEKRTIFDAIGEAEHLLEETVNKLDPDNERDSWFMVRLTKIREALADQGSLADAGPPVNATLLAYLKEMQASAEKLLLTVGWGNMGASERQAFNDASLRADIAIAQAEAGQ